MLKAVCAVFGEVLSLISLFEHFENFLKLFFAHQDRFETTRTVFLCFETEMLTFRYETQTICITRSGG